MTTPMRLSLAITADASGVAPATAEARREIESLGAQARETSRAQVAANDEAAVAARRATEAIKGQSAAERDLRGAVMQFAGGRTPLNDNEYRRRAADVQAYGDALDRLRARYNPLFAVTRGYLQSREEIRQAHRVGAISANEMTEALSRERQATLSSIAAIKGRNAAIADTPVRGGMGAGSFNTANIAAQFQDIGVTTAMGMSPLQIALQQGTQLSAVLEQMRSNGQSAGSALLGAFTSIISPVSLVTIGLIGAASAAVQWWMAAEGGGSSAQEHIDKYLEAIDEVNASYGRSADAAERFGQRSALSLAAAEDRARRLLEVTRDAQRAELEGSLDRALFGSSGISSAVLPAFLDDGNELAARFAPFQAAIKELRQDIAAGNPDFDRFQQRVQAIADTDPRNLQEWATKLFEMTDDAALTERVLAETADGLRDLSTIDPDTSRAQQRIQEIADVAERTTIRLRDLYVAGSTLTNMLAGMDALGRGVAPKGDAVRGSFDRAQEQFDFESEFQRRINPELFDKIDPMGLKKPKVDRDANAYRDVLKSADDRIAQMRTEIQLQGQVGAAAEALRYEQELLAQATDKGRSLDEKQIAAIKAKAEEYGRLKSELAATRLEQDLMFEREQLFRSPTEQRVFSTLRGADIDPASERGQAIAEQIRYNEQLEFGRDLARDFGNSLAEAFKDGKLEGQELLSIVIDLIQQLSNMPGGIGGFGGVLQGIFGGGFGAFPSAPSGLGLESGIGLFDSGGTVLGGNVIPFGPKTRQLRNGVVADSGFGPRHFKALLEEGETVLTRDMTGRAMNVMQGTAAMGGRQQRTQIEVEVFVRDDGTLGAIAREAGRSGGTEAADVKIKQSEASLPDRMNQAKRYPRRRGAQG